MSACAWRPMLPPLALTGLLLAGALIPDTSTLGQQVTIGNDRMLRVDGQKLFPVGLLQLGTDEYPDWNDRIRECGANLVWDIGYAFADSMPACATIRDSADATGYRLLVGSFDTWEWDDPATPELEVAKPMYPADSLATLLQCFSGSSAMIAFANRDEPVWNLARNRIGDIDSLHIMQTYSDLRVASPNRLVAMNVAPVHVSGDSNQWKADLIGFRDAADIIMFASYPYPDGPGTCQPVNVFGYPECTLDRFPDGLDALRQDVLRPDQPLWAIVQAHKYIPRKEARWQACMAVIHGANGILWGGHNWKHSLGDGKANWDVIAPIIAEFSELQEVLAHRNINEVFTVDPDLDVVCRAALVPGVAYMFVGSRRGASGNLMFSTGGLRVSWMEVLGENRWVPVAPNYEVVDTFEAYEAHIYRLDTSVVAPPTGAEVTHAIPEDGFHVRLLANPTTGRATARLRLPSRAEVDFAVYDVRGRRVATPRLERTGPTEGWLTWDGRTSGGATATAGVYFLRGTASTGERATARIVLRR